jgi:hypothetical protein
MILPNSSTFPARRCPFGVLNERRHSPLIPAALMMGHHLRAIAPRAKAPDCAEFSNDAQRERP